MMRPETEKKMKRWAEQRWIIDKMIEAQRGPFSPVSTSPRMYTMPAAIDGELDLISVSLTGYHRALSDSIVVKIL